MLTAGHHRALVQPHAGEPDAQQPGRRRGQPGRWTSGRRSTVPATAWSTRTQLRGSGNLQFVSVGLATSWARPSRSRRRTVTPTRIPISCMSVALPRTSSSTRTGLRASALRSPPRGPLNSFSVAALGGDLLSSLWDGATIAVVHENINGMFVTPVGANCVAGTTPKIKNATNFVSVPVVASNGVEDVVAYDYLDNRLRRTTRSASCTSTWVRRRRLTSRSQKATTRPSRGRVTAGCSAS